VAPFSPFFPLLRPFSAVVRGKYDIFVLGGKETPLGFKEKALKRCALLRWRKKKEEETGRRLPCFCGVGNVSFVRYSVCIGECGTNYLVVILVMRLV